MINSNSSTTDIVICNNCDGRGKYTKSELHDYHRGEYKYWDVPCQKCNSTGRLVVTTTTTVEVEPFEETPIDDQDQA